MSGDTNTITNEGSNPLAALLALQWVGKPLVREDLDSLHVTVPGIGNVEWTGDIYVDACDENENPTAWYIEVDDPRGGGNMRLDWYGVPTTYTEREAAIAGVLAALSILISRAVFDLQDALYQVARMNKCAPVRVDKLNPRVAADSAVREMLKLEVRD